MASDLTLDHVGLVVPDAAEAAQWYSKFAGCEIAWVEKATEVDSAAIGLPGEEVRLCGYGLRTGDGGAYLELHQFIYPTGRRTRDPADPGYGSLVWYADDVGAEYQRLSGGGGVIDGKRVEVDHFDDKPGAHGDGPGPRLMGRDWYGTRFEIREDALGLGPGHLVLSGPVVVVADLGRAWQWYGDRFDWPVVGEVTATVPGVPGEGPYDGLSLTAGGARRVELRKYDATPTGAAVYKRRACETGIGHMAVGAPDVASAHQRLVSEGVRMYSEPQYIADGGLAGTWWCYGEGPSGEVVEVTRRRVASDKADRAAV